MYFDLSSQAVRIPAASTVQDKTEHLIVYTILSEVFVLFLLLGCFKNHFL